MPAMVQEASLRVRIDATEQALAYHSIQEQSRQTQVCLLDKEHCDMKCPKCGAEVMDNARFCTQCGYPLKPGAKAPKVHVVEAKGAAEDADSSIDRAVRAAAEERAKGQTHPMGTVGDATVPTSYVPEATTRVVPDAMAETARVDDAATRAVDFETYIEEPATEAVFESEEEDADPSLGLERIDGESIDSDATLTQVAPVAVPLEMAKTRDSAPEEMPAEEEKASQEEDGPRAQQEEESKDSGEPVHGQNPKRHRAIAIAICAAVAALALGLIGYAFEWWGGVSVPDVKGLEEDVAVQKLEDAGFAADVSYTYVDSDTGKVLSQGTQAGTREAKGSSVSLEVGKARTIPDVIGKTKDEAASALSDIGAGTIHYVYQRSDSDAGTVLAVDPDVGTTISAGDTVTLTVAQGYEVPDVIGMTKDAAVSTLSQSGLVAKVVYVDADRTAGTVDSTDPAAGTQVSSGTVVTVRVANEKKEEKSSSLADADHIADYFSATPQDIATFMEQQGYALVYGASSDNVATCTYTKEYAPTIAFTPTPHAKAQTSGAKDNVLASGATVSGVQLTVAASDAGASALTDDGVSAVMTFCGLSTKGATVSSSSSSTTSTNGSSTSSSTSSQSQSSSSSSSTSTSTNTNSNGSADASKGSSSTKTTSSTSYICSAGSQGDLIWTVLLYQESGSSTIQAVVTCAPKDAYSAQSGDLKQIAQYAADSYLGVK